MMKSRAEWLSFYNRRELDENVILTNRMGNWEIISAEEAAEMDNVFVDEGLVRRLSEKYLVINEENQGTLMQRWAEYTHTTLKGPYLFIVHLTQRCNLTCSYCHSSAIGLDAVGRDLEVATAKQIAKFISKVEVEEVHIAFQGGEPFVMLDLIDVFCEEVKKLMEGQKLSFYITTNGTYRDERVKALIKKHDLAVSVSIDGPKGAHDAIRTFEDGSGSFDLAILTRREINEESLGKGAGSTLVLTKKTISEWQSFIDTYLEIGQTMVHLKPITKLGGAKGTWDSLGLEFEEFWDVYSQAIQYMAEKTLDGQIVVEKTFSFALEKVLGGKDTLYVDHRNPCGLVYGVLNFDVDGKIYACHEGKRKKEFLLGDAADEPSEVIFSDVAREISKASVLDQHIECRTCAYLPYCGPCPAHNAQTTGDMAVEPYESWHCHFTLKLYDLVFRMMKTDRELLEQWHNHKEY